MPKYKMLPVNTKSISSNSPQLYIIVAQEDFYAMDGTFIPCGTEGGFIESSENIPNESSDKSWIFASNGYVVGNAKIRNSCIYFGYISGNAVVENSVVDKKSNVMENAIVCDSTVIESIVGCSSHINHCKLEPGNCINLYEKMHITDSTISDSSISGNVCILDSRITNCAIHNSESKVKGYTCEILKEKTSIDNINCNYREKHGGRVFLRNNRKNAALLEKAKEEGDLRAESEAATGVIANPMTHYEKRKEMNFLAEA